MSAFLGTFAVLTALFAFVSALERVPAWQCLPQPFRRPWFATDVAWYVVTALAAGLLTFVFRPVLVQLALPGLSPLVANLPVTIRFLLAVLVFDLIAFSVHVAVHRSDTLWQFHKVHHSSRRLDALATTRTQPFELLIRNVPAQLALFALGVPADLVAVVVVVFGGFGALNHSNLRVPIRPAEWLFITPRLHRLHHVPATCQHNFATIFSFWDRAAGRLLRGDADPSEPLGVPGEIESFPQPFARAFREPVRQLVESHRSERSDPSSAPGHVAPASGGWFSASSRTRG